MRNQERSRVEYLSCWRCQNASDGRCLGCERQVLEYTIEAYGAQNR